MFLGEDLHQDHLEERPPNIGLLKGSNQLCETATLVVCRWEDDNDFLR